MQTNSIRNLTFNITFMPNTSTQRPFLKELETLTSTEDQELSSRDSRFLIGPPLKRDTAGNLMPTQDKLGIMHFTT